MKQFDIPDGSYSLSHIQDYFEYIFKKYEEKTSNPSTRVYVHKIENRITFKIKAGYYLELLTPETKKLRRSNKNKITKNGPYLEITEVVLVH